MLKESEMEAIILAGGFGTRLGVIARDVPKPMLPVLGKPFLAYLLGHLARYGVSKFILCTGYKHEIIRDFFGLSFMGIPVAYSIETEPLGTGGALLNVLPLTKGQHCLALNGDTFFGIDITSFLQCHLALRSDFTIALKKLYNFDRYGIIERHGKRIISFEEKKSCREGDINGGVYAFKKEIFYRNSYPRLFSLEKDFLGTQLNQLKIMGISYDDYFVDIGIPEDYIHAEREFSQKILS